MALAYSLNQISGLARGKSRHLRQFLFCIISKCHNFPPMLSPSALFLRWSALVKLFTKVLSINNDQCLYQEYPIEYCFAPLELH